MHRPPDTCRKSLLQNRTRRAWLAAAILALLAGAGSLSAQLPKVVATYNFNDGTADGWTSFNGASTPTASSTAAYEGSDSLLTSTGSNGQGGPSLNASTVLLPGAQYTITGYVRLTTGETATDANFTIKRTDASCSGGTCYDTIGMYQVAVDDSGWAQIGGTYTVATTAIGLTLYSQLVGPSTMQSFYLDDVVITETVAPAAGTPVASYTFSDGGLDGWTAFGAATLTNSASPVADPNSDARALLTSNRTATYEGPSLSLLNVGGIVAGATYQVSAYVLLAAPDSSNPTVTLSTKTVDCATTGDYGNIGTSAALSSTAWTQVQGTFSFSDLPGAPTSLVLYIQSSSATDSFYIGDVTISEVAPPPPNPSQQDNTGIASTFEDGGVDGWSSRSGSSTLANSTAAAHSGTHSLLVTGRTANWDGPQISVSDKMYPGSVYNISGWVMMQPADNSSHVINISLQTTLEGNTSYNSVSGYPGVTVPADGKWHQISVTGYNMSSAYDSGMAFLYFQTVPATGNDLASFYLDDFQLSCVAPPSIQRGIPSIHQVYSDYFPIGTAIDPTDLSGPHAQLLTKHYNSITSGNDMKWSSVEAAKGTFTFSTADSEVGLAVCHGIRIRGHNLVWATGAQTPSYAVGDGTNSVANQATVTANIQEHIQNEVQHFGSKVYAWDVVNEPLDPTQSDCLAHGPFYQVLGKSYIDVALKAARQYAPKGTKLYINDYSTTDPDRLACLVKLVKDLKNRDIPIDGWGHEMHNAINYPSTAAIVNTIETVHRDFPTLEQQVTELDMSVYNAGDTTSNYGNTIPPAVLAEQGWLYEQWFAAFRKLHGLLASVTMWGMADDDTWLDSFPVDRTDYPLPFDMQLKAKPAYWGIVEPEKLPGFGLHFTVASKPEPKNVNELTVTATNGDTGPAYATEIVSLSLRQRSGKPCTPTIKAPGSYPISLGDLADHAKVSKTFLVDFTGCNGGAHFMLTVPWSSSTYHTGTLETDVQFHKDK